VDSAADAAARAGIQEGDLILAVANTEVSSVKEFEAVVARLDKSRPVSLLVRRGDGAQYVLIRPTK
jgi:serine protease Do